MPFAFYPRHEDAGAHVGHCPHLAGAALATVVLAANDNQLHLDMLHGEASPTNQLVERALRPLVVLRKLTFGLRTAKGASRMARIMTVQETAKRHGRKTTTLASSRSPKRQSKPPFREPTHPMRRSRT